MRQICGVSGLAPDFLLISWLPPHFLSATAFCALFKLQFPLFSYLPPLFPYLPPENGGQLGKAVKTSSRAALGVSFL
jgi:hypothetical protein